MTGVQTQTMSPRTATDVHAAPTPRRNLVRQLRVPLVCLAACLVGFVLQFGLSVPGTPVWIGVIVFEIVAGGSAPFAGPRAAPAPSPPEAEPGVGAPGARPQP